MDHATVVFLRRNGQVCLAPKKGHIHDGKKSLNAGDEKLNGYGGKLEEGETPRMAAIRELGEEAHVLGNEEDLVPCAIIDFFWPGNTDKKFDMRVYFFFLDWWKGVPEETEFMGPPEFFGVGTIPYDRMLPADQKFLEPVFQGKYVEGEVWLPKKGDPNDHLRVKLDFNKTPINYI